jgi:L-lactate dehydrogenase (cytochrome)
MPPVTCCAEDLRVLAKRRMPRIFYDHPDSGSWTESTYRANEKHFSKIQLHPAGSLLMRWAWQAAVFLCAPARIM